ncbi:hypothetical protein ACSHWG_01075 [Leucobacter sp. Z1108]|uniref:hypothetical protein n=1 Tax=Leucobacter sp. Z1108 TaxID=3439066 RepID=UPI003F34B048
MRFPIDMHRDVKVQRLTDSQFRTFFEMNGEARLERNDGVFDKDDAEFRWSLDDLEGLCRSHPTSPLVVFEDERYRIRVYSNHQLTEDDRERLAEVARENGRKGGRPRKNPETQKNPDVTQAQAKLTGLQPKITQAKAESESESDQELKTDLTTSSVSQERNAREKTDSEESIEASKKIAETLSVNLDTVIKMAAGVERDLGYGDALRLGSFILAKASRHPRNPMAYIATAFQKNPHEVQQWIDREVAL